MNCQDFAARMQRRLDDRLPLMSDRRLQGHARQCNHCRGQLDVWQQIATILPPPESIAKKHRHTLAVCGLAAAALFALMIQWNSPQPNQPIPSERLAANHDVTMPLVGDDVNPAIWWRDVQDRDWVADTMPAVRNVRDSVAPLGRSLLQAVTILTIGGGDRPT